MDDSLLVRYSNLNRQGAETRASLSCLLAGQIPPPIVTGNLSSGSPLAKKHFRLLELPSEIRNLIYEQTALEGYTPVPRVRDVMGYSIAAGHRFNHSEVVSPHSGSGWLPKTAFNLSKTCGQIRSEVLPVLVKLNAVVFTIDESSSRISHLSPPFRLRHIQEFISGLSGVDKSAFLSRPLAIQLTDWLTALNPQFWTDLSIAFWDVNDLILLYDNTPPARVPRDYGLPNPKYDLREIGSCFYNGDNNPVRWLQGALRDILSRPMTRGARWSCEAKQVMLHKGSNHLTIDVVRLQRNALRLEDTSPSTFNWDSIPFEYRRVIGGRGFGCSQMDITGTD